MGLEITGGFQAEKIFRVWNAQGWHPSGSEYCSLARGMGERLWKPFQIQGLWEIIAAEESESIHAIPYKSLQICVLSPKSSTSQLCRLQGNATEKARGRRKIVRIESLAPSCQSTIYRMSCCSEAFSFLTCPLINIRHLKDLWHPWTISLFRMMASLKETSPQAPEAGRGTGDSSILKYDFGGSGSLIGRQWILTAKHCLRSFYRDYRASMEVYRLLDVWHPCSAPFRLFNMK